MNRKIEIVGSGPAGLVAAINLARAGYKITVYEEKPDVGHRFHGDFQGLENWSSEEDAAVLLERLGIQINYTCQPYNELTVFDANLNKRIIRSQRPLFYLVQRGHAPGCLDYGLMEQATRSGVEIVFNKRIDKLEMGGIIEIGPRAADAIAKGIIFNTTMEDIVSTILPEAMPWKRSGGNTIHHF